MIDLPEKKGKKKYKITTEHKKKKRLKEKKLKEKGENQEVRRKMEKSIGKEA